MRVMRLWKVFVDGSMEWERRMVASWCPWGVSATCSAMVKFCPRVLRFFVVVVALEEVCTAGD